MLDVRTTKTPHGSYSRYLVRWKNRPMSEIWFPRSSYEGRPKICTGSFKRTTRRSLPPLRNKGGMTQPKRDDWWRHQAPSLWHKLLGPFWLFCSFGFLILLGQVVMGWYQRENVTCKRRFISDFWFVLEKAKTVRALGLPFMVFPLLDRWISLSFSLSAFYMYMSI